MTFTTDPWTDRLSEYVDGELDAATREALEAHLEGCATCRGVRDDLRRVVARARATSYREPARDVWTSIERSIATPAHRSRPPFVISFTLGRLAMAAGLVAVIAGGLAWSLASRRTTVAPSVTATADSAPTTGVATPIAVGSAAVAVASYREAARDLERALDAGRGALRPETMRVIEANLRAMDVAIAQADSALHQDPGSEYLNQYLVATMQRKLKLLRHAVAITSPRT
jgi:anti-sigma factor RsiW